MLGFASGYHRFHFLVINFWGFEIWNGLTCMEFSILGDKMQYGLLIRAVSTQLSWFRVYLGHGHCRDSGHATRRCVKVSRVEPRRLKEYG
jgi:hypothetical protein